MNYKWPEQQHCFKHYLEDGEVKHCLGPFDHWGEHSETWGQGLKETA